MHVYILHFVGTSYLIYGRYRKLRGKVDIAYLFKSR
jgi:hypothetical protein